MNARFNAIVLAIALLVSISTGPTSALADRPLDDTASTYVVRRGDSLSAIARRLDVTLEALLSANGLTIRSVIQPGDELVVPTPHLTSRPTPNDASDAYVVKKGDTMIGIAKRAGTDVRSLRILNGFSATTVIHPGQTIRVPNPPAPAPAPGATAVPVPAAGLTTYERLTSFLRAQIGKPYKYFAAGPDSYDCSGLVVAAYRVIGVVLPHQSRALASVGRPVDLTLGPIKAGDLILLTSSTDRTQIGHVGVALSATTWIQAVGTGQSVRIGPIPTANIVTIRRVL